MTSNHKIIVVLTFLFFLVFTVMVLVGIDLTYQSLSNASVSDTEVKIGATSDSLDIELSTAIPGVVLIVFGAIGLFLMIIKVPAKEIVEHKNPHSVPNRTTLNYSLKTFQNQILSQQTIEIPKLIWWFVKNKGIFKQVS